jgi:hypothetical protein
MYSAVRQDLQESCRGDDACEYQRSSESQSMGICYAMMNNPDS